MSKLGIVDYGMGNLLSVQKAFEHLGASSTLINDPDAVAACDRLILPGVGAFGDAMSGLHERNLADPLKAYAKTGKPLLGICLGMQILCDSSEEAPGVPGLGLVAGRVPRFTDEGLKIPHMGWNSLEVAAESYTLAKLGPQPFVYFVHSYYVALDNQKAVSARTSYGIDFTSALEIGNLAGVQFHPEKSQATGLQILENFLSWNP